MSYLTRGVCSSEINVDVREGIIRDVQFVGGCNGNLKAIAMLVKGKKAEEVIELLKGLTCGKRPTSCGDQLAKALRQALGA